MKRILLPLILASVPAFLHAATPLETRLSSRIQPASAQFGTVTEAEKRLIISNVATTLGKHVAFRSDGTECSYQDSTQGRLHIEWMGLRVHKLAVVPLSQDDKDRGVSKRIQAQLAYDNCRLRDPKTQQWGAWSIKCPTLFPPAINFEWVGGRMIVDGGLHLDSFKPGPMSTQSGSAGQVAVNEPARTSTSSDTGNSSKPAGPGLIKRVSSSINGLPAGMTRQ